MDVRAVVVAPILEVEMWLDLTTLEVELPKQILSDAAGASSAAATATVPPGRAACGTSASRCARTAAASRCARGAGRTRAAC